MTLMRFEPGKLLGRAYNPLLQMFEEFDRVVNQSPLALGNYAPRVDLSEDKENLYLVAELPGMTESDVKVTVTDGVLSIRGEKKRKEEHESRNYYRIERSHGEFVRQFNLPENLKEEEITAEFADGLLEIRIPKAEPVKPNEREIKIGRSQSQNKIPSSAERLQKTNEKSDSHVNESGKVTRSEAQAQSAV